MIHITIYTHLCILSRRHYKRCVGVSHPRNHNVPNKRDEHRLLHLSVSIKALLCWCKPYDVLERSRSGVSDCDDVV